MLRFVQMAGTDEDLIHPITFDVDAEDMQNARLRRSYTLRSQPVKDRLLIELSICRELGNGSLCNSPAIQNAEQPNLVDICISMNGIALAGWKEFRGCTPEKIFIFL